MPHGITSPRGDLSLLITVDDKPLPVYDIKYTQGDPSAWIACETGKPYSVHLGCRDYPQSAEFRKTYSSLNAELSVDGVIVEEMTSVGLLRGQEAAGKEMKDIVWKGSYVRPGYRRSFIFEAPDLLEKGSHLDPLKTQALGSIQIPVRRIQVRQDGISLRNAFKRVKMDLSVPEDSKKGMLSGLTTLGKAEKTPPTVMYNIVAENPYDKVKPMATLTLHYATREVLMARGIIPCPNGSYMPQADRKTQVDAASHEEEADDPDEIEVIDPIRWTGNNGTASSRRRKREEAEDDKDGVREAIKRLKAAHRVDGGLVDLTGDGDSD